MALLLAGLPDTIPGVTVNRLCASGLNAVGAAAQAIRAGEIDFAIAGGVESMTRAPFVMGKASEAFSRSDRDLRHHHRLALRQSADEAAIRRRPDAGDRPRTSPRNTRSRARTRTRSRCARSSAPARRMAAGFFEAEIAPVEVPGGKAGPVVVDKDEHPRPDTTLEGLAKLKPFVRNPGTITAGNASGVNDGAAAMIIASEAGREGARPHAARAHPRHGVGRRAAARHGHRPGAVDAQADGAARPQDRRFRLDRAQRGVRLAGARLPAPARRSRTMPSTSIRTAARSRSAIRSACRARGLRITATHQTAGDRRQARARHHVRRRRAGRVAGDRAGSSERESPRSNNVRQERRQPCR